MLRAVWALPIGVLLWAFELTRSRGGFLAMAAAVSVMLFNRLGWRRGLMVVVLCCPILIPFLDARQTDFDLGNTNDTAQGRMEIWRDSMVLFHHEPIFGLGVDRLVQEVGLVAHNSFVQAFAETGLIGGTMFVGAIYVPIAILWQVRQRTRVLNDELMLWNTSLLAICVGYAVGIFSLSRNYVVPTYLPAALATSYCGVIAARYPALESRLSRSLFRQVAIASVACVALLEVWCRLLVK